MPKRRRRTLRTCKPCQPCKARRTCRKRRGSPRFPSHCKLQFKQCMKGELQESGSLKSAGRACMTALHQCATKSGLRGRRSKRRRG